MKFSLKYRCSFVKLPKKIKVCTKVFYCEYFIMNILK